MQMDPALPGYVLSEMSQSHWRCLDCWIMEAGAGLGWGSEGTCCLVGRELPRYQMQSIEQAHVGRVDRACE